MKQSSKIAMAVATIVAMFFVSCENPAAPPAEYTPGDPGGAITRIILDNSANEFRVSVYDHYSRTNAHRLGDFLVGGEQSGEIDWHPHPQGFIFFQTYHFNVEDFSFQFNAPRADGIHVATPSGTVTRINVPPFSSVVGQDTLLTNRVYLSIRNNDPSRLITLNLGTIVQRDLDNEEPEVRGINPRETARFNVSPGNAARYHIMALLERADLPVDIEFLPGHIYFMEFGGTTVTLDRYVPINVNNAEGGYRVTFNANEGLGAPPVPRRVPEGSALELPVRGNLTREGYTFGGWNTRADGTGRNYMEGATFTPTGNVTLFARWSAFRVDFDINEGIGTAPAQRQVPANSYTLLPDGTGFSRPGFTFAGWNTLPDGGGTTYNAGAQFTPSTDTTLYAVWSFGGTLVPGPGLPEILAWLRDNAQNNGDYTIELSGNSLITPTQAALPTGRSNVTITLRGSGEERSVNLSTAENGSLKD